MTSLETKKQFRLSDSASDSEGSDEDSVSLTSSQVDGTISNLTSLGLGAATAVTGKTPKKRGGRKTHQEWDIVEGLKDGQTCFDKPERHQGYLMKRRKWPMKGWHKRFFSLENGILTYAKSQADIPKGKYHGIIDIGLAVLNFKRQGHRLDIDAEEQIHHIKIKDSSMFNDWIDRLRHHRLYRQQIISGNKSVGLDGRPELSAPSEDIQPLSNANLPELARHHTLKKDLIRQSSIRSSNQGRVMAWILDSSGFEQTTKQLQTCQSELGLLKELLENLQSLPISSDSGMESQLSSPSEQTTPTAVLLSPVDRLQSSASNPNLLNHFSNGSNKSVDDSRDSKFDRSDSESLDLHGSRIKEIRLRENFVQKADIVFNKVKDLVNLVSSERERLRNTLEQEHLESSQLSNLKHQLFESQKQNAELRGRLARIHADSSLTDTAPHTPLISPMPSVRISRNQEKGNLAQSVSIDSFSLSEYYDAEENIETISDSSSEPSDGEASSEMSEDGNDTDHTTGGVSASEATPQSICATGRRSRLPVPKPESPDVSLWNLLYRNIGKDLTKISMPVTLNEPLSMLQRLCEELEYSELLDKAAEYNDPYERMIYVAAFAVSSYSSSYYREGHKPFNPLLGETYECVREDKGWKFIAEQVNHHPPISACFCESRNFTFWQDVRIKTKFWGKSMEIQPLGHVNLSLPKYNEHYRWNKVTTCVHNLLGGQRWADQYGEMTITNGNIVCKLTFTKGSNQGSSKRYEVYGNICTSDGKVVHNLFGKWNEAFFCGHAASAKCVWRPGAMPEDYELYYGFTRFAIELNELDADVAKFLPPTDTRFRPDQRLLEEGRIQESEVEKHRLENQQRERRKRRETEKGEEHHPLWFRKTVGEGKVETYEYSNKYWQARKDPGFATMSFLKIF